MSSRTYSGVESLRGVERTGSLHDEYSFQGHSAGNARPSPLAQKEGHLERRNSHPREKNLFYVSHQNVSLLSLLTRCYYVKVIKCKVICVEDNFLCLVHELCVEWLSVQFSLKKKYFLNTQRY